MRAYQFITEYSRETTSRGIAHKLIHRARMGDDAELFSKVDDDSIIDVLFDNFENSDPSPKMSYVPWLAREYSKGNIRRLEDIPSRFAPLLQDHHDNKLKKDFPAKAKDIMSINADEFEDIMNEYSPPEKELVDKGDSEEIYSDDDVRVIVPYDEDAACYYGQGTKWCTAATKGDNMFDEYASKGTLYIIIPKDAEYPGEKYQLHFVDKQYMDDADEPVSLNYVIRERFPQLEDFFLKWEGGQIKRLLDTEKPIKHKKKDKPEFKKKKDIGDVFKKALKSNGGESGRELR